MNNDILGDLPPGKLTYWKPNQYRASYDVQTLNVYYKCRAGEGRGLVPPIHSMLQGLPLTDISIETHESNKIEFVSLTYSLERVEEDPDDPDDPGGPSFEFDGNECEITVSLVDDPISQCSLYKTEVNGLDNSVLTDLCALMGGQLSDEQGTKLADKLNGKVSAGLLSKILRGQTHYKAPYMQCRLTIPSKVSINDAGKISSRAGLPTPPQGMTWLCAGGGCTRRNGRSVTQITYISGNWDPDIYSK